MDLQSVLQPVYTAVWHNPKLYISPVNNIGNFPYVSNEGDIFMHFYSSYKVNLNYNNIKKKLCTKLVRRSSSFIVPLCYFNCDLDLYYI